MTLVEITLTRLYNAAVRYYLLKEVGEPEGAVEAAEIRSEMFAALLDIRLQEDCPIEPRWYDAGQIHFGWKDGNLSCEYVPPGGADEDS